jgi:hypothetical protein
MISANLWPTAQLAGDDCHGIDEEGQPNIFLGGYKFFLGKINFPTSFPNNNYKPQSKATIIIYCLESAAARYQTILQTSKYPQP